MNKKRLGKFIAVSSVFVVSTLTGVAIAGCKGCSKHEHNLTEVSAVEPTCTTDGRSAYYVCDGCELVFADAEGKTEIDVAETVKPKLNHDLQHHAADSATCTKPGNIEYWECSRGDGKFSDAEGKNPVENVETTKDHTWGETGHHAQVDPTTESEGVKEYWHCSECNLDYADEFGDRKVTLEELKIDKVSENIDGELTTDFYPTANALTIGGADVREGGKGVVINAKRASDGVYLHITVNYDLEATKQPAGRGKIGLYFNVRNTDNLNLPGGAGVCLEQAMLMELYLTGKVDYHKPYFLMEFETKTNEEGSKTKYTNTWEMFIPHSGFATVNDGAFAEAFETVEGKTVLKAGYTYMLTAIGAMDATETFENHGASKCEVKDENTWAFWINENHGDWGTDQKYYVLGAQGVTQDFQRATDIYTVEVNDYANATVTGLTDTVDYDKKLEGTVTVNEGYRLSGIRVNGQVFTFEKAADANTYAYEIVVSQLTNLKWNDAALTVEVVVTKLEYQTVTLTLKGIAGGKTQNIAQGTAVTVVSDFGDEYSSEVGADGKVQFSDVLCQSYSVRINDYIDGLVTVVKGEQTAETTLEYHFAHNAGTRGDLVDLSEMNAENASVTLGAQGVNGVDKDVVAVQLNLSEEMKNAEAYVLYTTVNVNGDVSESKQNTWLQRFGIRFAEGDANNTYNNKFVVWWDDLGLNSNPSAIWANDGAACGGGAYRVPTFEWLASSVMDGLKIKVVRNGGSVSVSVFNLDDEKWYTLLSGATSASAKNDISFFVSGESFTFSDISFEELDVVPLVLPIGETDGVKGHLIATNGDMFTLGGILATAEELAIPAESFAFTDYDNVEIDGENGVITITGNGIADRDSHAVNHANYILSEAVRGEKEVSLTFKVKDIQEGQGSFDWAARRFGIQVGEGAYGLYFWSPQNEEFNVIRLVQGTLDMNTDAENTDIAKAHWAAPIIRSSDGLDVQIVRIGDKIVVNLKNADGAWVRVGEMDCPEATGTEIKFVGGGDTWEISAIATRKVQAVSAKDATAAEDGNIAYFTDGTNYYKEDGSVTTAAAVVIPKIVEKTVEINVEVYGTDGNKITDADLSAVKVTLTGEYDYNRNIYTDLSITEGKLALTENKIFAGAYSVAVNGYAVDAIVVGEDTASLTLALHKIAGYQIVEAENTGSVGFAMSTDGLGVTITGSGLVDDNKKWSGTAELTIPDEVKSRKDVILSLNVKLSDEHQGGWDWASRRFGITMQGTNGGFMCFTPNGNEAGMFVMGELPSSEDGSTKVECNAIAALLRSANGANMRIVRADGKVTVFVEGESVWEKLGSFNCDADGDTKIVLYGLGDTWTFSNIAVYSAPATFVTPDDSVRVSADIVRHSAVEPSAENEYMGIIEHYTVGSDYYLPDGTKTTAEEVKIQAKAVTVTVTAFEKDGTTEVTLSDGTEIALTGRYLNYTYIVGTGLDKMIPGEYEVFLYGYGKLKITVPADGGEVEIELIKTFAYTAVGTHGGNSGVAVEDETVTITGNGLADDNKTWAGSAELVISEQFKNSKNIVLEFTLKDTYRPTDDKGINDGAWDWTARRFGVTVQGANGGFMLFTPFSSEASLYKLGDEPGIQAEEIKCNDVAALVRSESGVKFKLVRIGGSVTVLAELNGEMVKLGVYGCSADGDTKIVFYGEGDTWECSAIASSMLEYVSANDATTETAGNIAYYTDGTNYYKEDGSVTTAAAVVIPKIVEKTVEINVEVYGTDGNKITDANLSAVKVTLTGEYDYNRNIYTDLSINEGKLALTENKIFAGAYSVAVNGYAVDAIVVGEDTASLTLALHKIAGYQITEVAEIYYNSEKAEKVTTGFNKGGVTIKISADKGDFANWAEAVPEATLDLPAAVAESKNVSVEFNIKAVNSGFWACNAFGVSITEGYKGFGVYLSNFDKDDSSVFKVYAQKLRENDDNMTFLGDYAWLETLARSSEGGLTIRIVRAGAKLELYAKNEQNKWVKLAQSTCAADSATEIRFMGQGADYEISNIVVCTAPAAFAAFDEYVKLSENIVYHEYVAPSIQNEGIKAYYSFGNVLYTESGVRTTLEDLKISKLSATAITITVKGHKDGVETLLSGAVSATGEYDTSFSGTLDNGVATVDAYLVTYNVSVEGYIAKEFTVEADKTEYTIVLEYIYATGSGSVDLSKMNDADHTITITGSGLVNDNKEWAGKAELTLSDEIKNVKNVELSFNLKLTGEHTGGWDWAARRFGVTMQGANGGFMCFSGFPDGANLYVMGNTPGAEDGSTQISYPAIASLIRSEAGLNMRVLRFEGSVILFAEISDEWVKIGSFNCNSADSVKVALYGVGDTWVFSNISLAKYTGTAAELIKGEIAEGVTVSFNAENLAVSETVKVTLTGGKHFLVSVNGKQFTVGNEFDISYEEYSAGIANPTVTVSVLGATDFTTALNNPELGSNKVIDLTAAELDGKELLDWNRYKRGSVVTKEGNNSWVFTGMDELADGGGDYDDPNGIKIKSEEGEGTGEFFCMGGGNYSAHSSVTVKVAKGATQVNIYTGSWQGGNNVKFTVKCNGAAVATETYTFGDRRSALVTFAVDTSAWDDGEVRDIVIEIDPASQGYMLAAIAVLGAATVTE